MLKEPSMETLYNMPSNPWIYVSGGSIINTREFRIFQYVRINLAEAIPASQDGRTNDKHYVATFDISAIDLSNGAVFHNTMECGNDNLIGQVPEPTTMLLLGLGLIGLVGVSRKFKK